MIPQRVREQMRGALKPLEHRADRQLEPREESAA